MTILPKMLRLADVARELGVHGAQLVQASRHGTFVRLVRVGRLWFVPADELSEWVSRQHAEAPSPLALDRVRAAGAAVAAPRQRRPRRPRASTSSSS